MMFIDVPIYRISYETWDSNKDAWLSFLGYILMCSSVFLHEICLSKSKTLVYFYMKYQDLKFIMIYSIGINFEIHNFGSNIIYNLEI